MRTQEHTGVYLMDWSIDDEGDLTLWLDPGPRSALCGEREQRDLRWLWPVLVGPGALLAGGLMLLLRWL